MLSVKLSDSLFYCWEMKTHALQRLMRNFFKPEEIKLLWKKRKLHDILTDKMLSSVKLSDCFWARKEKRTLYGGRLRQNARAADVDALLFRKLSIKLIAEKKNLDDILNDKMLFSVKQSDYFSVGKKTRTLYGG